MQKLVFITQAVDAEHPVLAATIPKIRALAARVDEVVVLAQSARAERLPENVDVRVFGSQARAGRGLRFEREHRRELERFGYELGGAVPRADLPKLFARADLLLNNMRAGAPDKVVYEAAAACLPVLASNPVFDELFEEFPLQFDREDPESLAGRLRWFASLAAQKRAEIGGALRRRVAERHSVETWADGVLEAVR